MFLRWKRKENAYFMLIFKASICLVVPYDLHFSSLCASLLIGNERVGLFSVASLLLLCVDSNSCQMGCIINSEIDHKF